MTSRTEPNRLSIAVPAAIDKLAGVRARLRSWLADRAVSPNLRADIVLAVDEAVANAVEHGYRHDNEPGPVNVTIEIGPETVTASVTDHGSWKQPMIELGSARGRGLKMITALADRVALISTPRGTALTARFAIHE